MKKSKNRVLAIGLDCATFSVIKPLVQEGKLKFFDFLLENSFSAILKSTIPPVTAPAWASFATGKNPGKHGIFSFMIFNKPNVKIVNSRSIKSITFWELLSLFGKKVCIINVPLTYPPKRINGILIPGMLTPPGKLVTYPSAVVQLLKESSYIVDVYYDEMHPNDHFFEKVVSMIRKRLNIALKLLNIEMWDFFLVTFVALDRVQHKFWRDGKKIRRIYEEVENAVKKLIQASAREYTILIFSDHGFTDVKKKVKINLWLASKGYLKVGRPTISETMVGWPGILKKQASPAKVIKEGFSRFADMLNRFGIDFNKTLLCKIWRHPISFHYSLDFKNSLAYFTHHEAYGIHILKKENLIQYNILRDKLIRDISKMKDPATNEFIFENIYKKEEIYWGKYVN
jgi:predicted AlkP superfamily phosphohydrolase/phosphomutase